MTVPSITANELFVIEGGARIRTRCPKEHVTDAMIAKAARHHTLDIGDIIRVLCLTHERDAVLWMRDYIVAGRRDFLNRTENEIGNVNFKDDFDMRVVPLVDWREITPTTPAETAGPTPTQAQADPVPTKKSKEKAAA